MCFSCCLGVVEYVVRQQSVMQTEVSSVFVLQVRIRISLETVARKAANSASLCWDVSSAPA